MITSTFMKEQGSRIRDFLLPLHLFTRTTNCNGRRMSSEIPKNLSCLRSKLMCPTIVTFFTYSRGIAYSVLKCFLTLAWYMHVKQNHWDLIQMPSLYSLFAAYNKLFATHTVKRTIMKYLLLSYYAPFHMPGILFFVFLLMASFMKLTGI